MDKGQIHEPYHFSDADAGLDHCQTEKPLVPIRPANFVGIDHSLLHLFQFVELVCAKNVEREETGESDARPSATRDGSNIRL
jgi:hypothetical protein